LSLIQSENAVSIGPNAGQKSQWLNAVSIGHFTGENNQKDSSIAIGFQAGQIFSGYFADNVNWFNTATQKPGTSSLYATDFTSLLLATNNQGSGDNFSVQWYGNIVTPVGSGGIWTFSTRSDDASYLWIGNNASSGYTTVNSVVNNGGTHGPQIVSGTISLTENTSYNIRVQFGEDKN
jgi:hypothetical protein